MQNYAEHSSVLLNECINFLGENVHSDQTVYFADLTFGGGGHSFALAHKFPDSKIIAVDQDVQALENGQQKIDQSEFKQKIFLHHLNFENFSSFSQDKYPEIFSTQGGFQGILCDLGVSSHHFDSAQRGFSFRDDGPLDMRMNQESNQLTAEEIINTWSEQELAEIFEKYGEERFSKRIASEIVNVRKKTPLKTTKQLEEIIFTKYPQAMRHGRTHPATRCFQALRITVNRELEILEKVIPDLFNLLTPGGRLAIISFHSLEDRIVKNSFKKIKENFVDQVKIITKKPVIPSQEELGINKRSRSAKLRCVEKVKDDSHVELRQKN